VHVTEKNMLLRPLSTAPGVLPGLLTRGAVRRRLARWMRLAATRLLLAARHLAGPRPVPPPVDNDLPHLEFHADAGAPEGALYVDGEFVGRLDVGRL
jgi:hypothetical protein